MSSRNMLLLLSLFLFTSAEAYSAVIDESFKIKWKNLFPEGIAYDEDTDRIFVTSAQAPAVYQIDDPVDNKTIVPSRTSIANVVATGALGLSIDKPGNTIYAALYTGDQTSTGGVASFDLTTLAQKNLLMIPGTQMINDVIVADDGYIYVTETRIGAVYSLPKDLSSYQIVSIQHTLLEQTNLGGANGILYMNGFLLVSNFDKQSLIKVPVKYGLLSADLKEVSISNGRLERADGLVRFNNSTIACIAGANTTMLTTEDDWETGLIETSIVTRGASTGAYTGSGKKIYVIFPDFNNLAAGNDAPDFKVVTIDFDQAFALVSSLLFYLLAYAL